jgi:hypothetical protein
VNVLLCFQNFQGLAYLDIAADVSNYYLFFSLIGSKEKKTK